jgi:heme exporter protein A
MRLEARDLCVERSGRMIFAQLFFALAAGQCLIVTGENGAGKSTLLRALAGLLPITSGALFLNGEAIQKPLEQAHYIGHSDALKAMLSLRENIEFWSYLLAENSSQFPPQKSQSPGIGPCSCGEALARLGLAHARDLPAGILSAGQKRRAALAKLLVAPRPLWLLDEPLTALDTNSQAVVKSLMQAHLAGGGMIVTSTHMPLGLTGQELRLGPANVAPAAP